MKSFMPRAIHPATEPFISLKGGSCIHPTWSASERAMMKKHLEWLKKKGMAYSDKDHFYLDS